VTIAGNAADAWLGGKVGHLVVGQVWHRLLIFLGATAVLRYSASAGLSAW
jgi:hypothetical protein